MRDYNNDPFADIELIGEEPGNDEYPVVQCERKDGVVNVHDLDATSGGGWLCPWCDKFIPDEVVIAAYAEFDRREAAANVT